MSRGFGKYRRGSSHHNFHFDTLFKENANKPTAARSAASVGKWGITSFTSIRTLNGRQDKDVISKEASAPKPKKFFKSRDSKEPKEVPNYSSYESAPKKARTSSFDSDTSPVRTTTNKISPKKFFASKSSAEKSRRNSDTNDPSKPPIVLRICRGKSQLIDTDDDAAAAVVALSPTSPRALREPNNSQPQTSPRATNCRITRSARRSMQMDVGAVSPALSTDSSIQIPDVSITKNSDVESSPQYVPADKFEEERRAMYASLLKPDSPKVEEENKSIEEVMAVLDGNTDEGKIEEETVEEKLARMEEEQSEETIENIAKEVEGIRKKKKGRPKAIESVKIDVIDEVVVMEEPKTKKEAIEADWGTDSDSSATPEIAAKPTIPDQPINSPAPSIPALSTATAEADEEEVNNDIEKNKDKILEKILEKPADPPTVKLVISKKKGSIFKSRALINDDTKKTRARYVHKWTDREGGETPARPPITNSELDSEFDFDGDLTRVSDTSPDVTSVKCNKTDKGYYTVVRNVKKAHQIQEIGEFQEFNDDVEYILDALQDNNPVSTRCLSAITLASKCMVPAFRMHVRAHGTVAKFFKALHDATKDQSLGLCTATVMFVLSQDRLNMDLDRDCLELMLNLLESDVSYQQALDVCGLTSSQLEKNKQKVQELCGEIQSQGHAMHLNLENITTGQLAMETLLSLTSKRAGEWFKEELRELGGLEHIMKTIHECCRQVSDYVYSWTDALLDKLKKVDRCLRVLENVTQNNEENQTYILKYNDGMMIDTLVNLYKLCDGEIALYPVTDITDKSSTGTIVREALLVTLKVLINLTHHYRQQSIGSQLVGARSGIIETSLHLLLQVPNYIPEQKKFELGVLVLMLLINLIQDQEANKKLLMEARAPSKLESIYSKSDESAVEALIVQFYEWEGFAKMAETKTNAILDGEKDEQEVVQPTSQKSNEEFIEETVAKLLQKAGTHMEYTFLASYIVMLLGFLIMDNIQYQTTIRQYLRGTTFQDMVDLLKKFFNFMNLTASTEASSVCAVKATQKVIKFLESCDRQLDAAATTTTTTVVNQLQDDELVTPAYL